MASIEEANHPQHLTKNGIAEYSFEEAVIMSKMRIGPDHSPILVRSYYHTHQDQRFPIWMHSHDFYELNIISGGVGYHYVGDKCIKVQKGDVFVIPPIIQHGYYSDDKNFEIFHLLLSGAFMERYRSELHALPGFTLLFETEPYLRSVAEIKAVLSLNQVEYEGLKPLFDKLFAYETSEYMGSEVIKTSIALYLLSILSEKASALRTYNPDAKETPDENLTLIIKAMEYIQSNCAEKIELNHLCSIANMSRSTFIRKFENVSKCTVGDFIADTRLDKAKSLLRETDSSISDIAQSCGFYDNSHFTNAFTKEVGSSPSKFRDLFRNRKK